MKKRPIFFTFLPTAAILFTGSVIIQFGYLRIEELGKEQAKIANEARSLGIKVPAGIGRGHDTGPRITKRWLRPSSRKHEHYKSSLVGLIGDLQQARYDGRKDDLDTQKMESLLETTLMDLSPTQVRSLLLALRENDDIEYEERKRLIGFAIEMLEDRYPDEFIEIGLLPGSLISDPLRSKAFVLWAERDINGLIAWMKRNQESRPDMVNAKSWGDIASSVSKSNPALAFQILGDLSEDNQWRHIISITCQKRTDESRTETLQALREHLATQSPESRAQQATRAYEAFSYSLMSQTCDESIAWLEAAGLDDKEREMIFNSIGYNQTQRDRPKWLAWISENLPPELRDRRTSAILEKWTEYDFHAAGTWLANSPDNPAKPAAIRAYAEAVAPFEPENAEKWSLTLPDRAQRQELLETIHQRWPAGEDAAKAAFAARHGIR